MVLETTEKKIKEVLYLRLLNNYSEIRLELAIMWDKETSIVPITIAALISIPEHMDIYLKKRDIPYSLSNLQKNCDVRNCQKYLESTKKKKIRRN